MRHRLAPALVSSLVLMVPVALAQTTNDDHAQEWSPAAAITMRVIEPPSIWGGDLVRVSPDNRSVFVVTRTADLQRDLNLYELLVFSHSAIDRGFDTSHVPAPSARVELTSATNQPAISEARWTEDGSRIAFLGQVGNVPQAFIFDPASGTLTRLTNAELGVYSFDFRDDSLIFLARVEERENDADAFYPARFVESSRVVFDRHWINDTFATFASYQGSTPRRIGEELVGAYPLPWTQYHLSPDGRFAIAFTRVTPEESRPRWSQYDRQGSHNGANRFWQRFFLIDLRSGETRPILNTPTGKAVGNDDVVTALWSPDGERVILTNICLPMRGGAQDRAHSSFMVDYRLATGSYRIVRRLPPVTERDSRAWAREVRWEGDGHSLRVIDRSVDNIVLAARRYERVDGGWREILLDDAASPTFNSVGRYSLSVVQTDIEAPTLVASYQGRSQRLLSDDPQLAGVQISHQQPISWTDETGRTWNGSLNLPNGSRRPLPLVVQLMSRMNSNQFQVEGSATVAHAAQSLTVEGFAVLRINLADVPGDYEEAGPSFVAGLDAGVRQLSSRGIIDPERVGLIGHSWAGYLTQYAITHPGRVHLRAAIAADTFSGGYFEYMFVNPGTQDQTEYESLYGGSFWQSTPRWLEGAPTFNANRSETPLLLMPIGPGALIGTQELFSSLRLNHRPADLLYFPAGDHQLVRPRERLASVDATLDWMSFWILGRETDIDAAQLLRWRRLRDEWSAASRTN